MVKRKLNNWRSLVLLAVTSVLLVACEPAPPGSAFPSLLVQQGKSVTRPASFHFPEDHLAHPQYGIEWWYLTANLRSLNEEPLWLQWTLFRIRNQQTANSWSDGQFYMAHFSLHSEQHHTAKEMFASGGVGNTTVSQGAIQINHWQLQKTESGLPSGLTVNYFDSALESDVSVDLQLNTRPDYLLHGDAGFSLKHPQTELASYYYSLPFIDVAGSVHFDNMEHQVSGNAWYDHEWSSMFLSQDFSGWNWFSIHLHNGSKLTLFTLIPSSNSAYKESWYGAMMTSEGEVLKLNDTDIEVAELSWQQSQLGTLPASWRIDIESLSLELDIKTKKSQQISPFSIPYYEGAVVVNGSHKGVGFVEMTR